MKQIAVLLIMLFFSGCAAIKERFTQLQSEKPICSYVEQDITGSDAKEIAQDMANFLAMQLPSAKTTLELHVTGTEFYPLFREQLTRRGFGVVEVRPGMEWKGVFLRYRVTHFHNGILVRMSFDGKAPSRYYGRGEDGRLSLNNKFAVREDSK